MVIFYDKEVRQSSLVYQEQQYRTYLLAGLNPVTELDPQQGSDSMVFVVCVTKSYTYLINHVNKVDISNTISMV